mmetsp:Transcript_23113/g.33859  ORF Transcript_23113/g.33859 Transcript_23113/m.33859 type:complete len:451 (-) Transcript_23113:51-1403(-)|eukprot:CAMPEP_0185037708 /NCGR_PEP_ID=MMETSP1103-20130426/32496_1 /TAXON_ID=36769 /ORGANISM="Paraphysomonas bandaiensis, Strain Caron Lab Isolate" /LENGTH=450 /DNA_ID=CAMNT_0027575817 /DNA_START=91 /DNA_END=1443 /DNA_ORIENTATION=-
MRIIKSSATTAVLFLSIFFAAAEEKCNSQGKYFYIYDWPDELTNLWPNVTKSTADLTTTASLYHGAGAILDSNIGLHETFQFALFKLFIGRAMLDPRRTLDPEKASLFFIPYDSGIDASMSRKGLVRAPGCPRAQMVMNTLLNGKHFLRNYGHDHFIVHSINQAMGFMHRRPGCRMYLGHFCENCTKLAIDTYPNCGDSPHWHAVPFPSNTHWSSRVSHLPWEYSPEKRKFAVSFTGTVLSHSKKSVIIRRRMRESCLKHPDNCHLNEMKSHFSGSSPPNWAVAANSTFCLMPPGDMPTRKGFFDSILFGCIPVVCDRYSAHRQWEWNLGLDVALATTVYIPCWKLLHNSEFDLVEMLVTMHNEHDEVLLKREAISKHAAGLQYRLVEDNHSVTPPRDAYDIIMDKLFDTLTVDFVKEQVRNPRDTGDHNYVDKFPNYPKGKYNRNFTVS